VSTDNQVRKNKRRSWYLWGYRVFLGSALLILGGLIMAVVGTRYFSNSPTVNDPTLAAFATLYAQPGTKTATQQPAGPVDTATPAPTRPSTLGMLVYSAWVDGYSQLWAYSPGDPAPLRLTAGEWDDRDPAISPDGTSVAFRSNRTGSWDLWLLNLTNGELRQVTDTPAYEGHPTWSPDGAWLAYEFYAEGDLDISILPIDRVGEPFQLTNHIAADFAPVWDPGGRRIAFVSDRDGNGLDIFIADLDAPNDASRFFNITQTPGQDEISPAYTHTRQTGNILAYTIREGGVDRIFVHDITQGDAIPYELGLGGEAAWGPGNLAIAAVLPMPYSSRVVVYNLDTMGSGQITFPIAQEVNSVSWSEHRLPPQVNQISANLAEVPPIYATAIGPDNTGLGRIELVEIADLQAPNSVLSDAVDEAFNALRQRTIEEAGWDFLGRLEYAFVGINEGLPPGYPFDDWLYTGRAFAFSPQAARSGWVEIVREDFGGQTFWRVYVRVADQSGVLGEPMRSNSWDFETRYLSDPQAYDSGGSLKPNIPTGYYLDFTQLAHNYGFDRVAALYDWRTFYHGARYNEFVHHGDLNWFDAMVQIYPEEAIITPTPFKTPTATVTNTPRPTPTPWWLRWWTPTPGP
jgi:TolB protein